MQRESILIEIMHKPRLIVGIFLSVIGITGLVASFLATNFFSPKPNPTPSLSPTVCPSPTEIPSPSPSPSEPPTAQPTTAPTPTPCPPTPTPKPSPTPTPQTPAPTPTGFTQTPPEISKVTTTRKQVVFTFDGGAGTQSAEAILTTLHKHGVRGTFFTTGKWAEQNPGLIRKINDQGHEIFNHTYSHPHLTQLSDQAIRDELQKTETIIKNLTGKTTKPYFRPPYGERTTHIRAVASEQGYQSVYWTIDALDWKETEGYTTQQVKDRIFANLQPGAIYLMHIGDTITGNVLDSVFTEIKNRGYSINPLTEGLK